MPLLAGLLASLSSAFAAFFVQFLSLRVAAKLAAYSAWMVLMSAFLVSVFVCVSSLLAMLTTGPGSGAGGPGWLSYFMMGVGIFIPANAAAVMSCVGSVWIATYVFQTQAKALATYGH